MAESDRNCSFLPALVKNFNAAQTRRAHNHEQSASAAVEAPSNAAFCQVRLRNQFSIFESSTFLSPIISFPLPFPQHKHAHTHTHSVYRYRLSPCQTQLLYCFLIAPLCSIQSSAPPPLLLSLSSLSEALRLPLFIWLFTNCGIISWPISRANSRADSLRLSKFWMLYEPDDWQSSLWEAVLF